MQQNQQGKNYMKLEDYGNDSIALNVKNATLLNNNFRLALWTGDFLQLTLMSIPVGNEIGLEIHPELDQFLYVEQGIALTKMGKHKNSLTYEKKIGPGCAVLVPYETWHNLINVGNVPLKVFSIYAPPEHAFGTIHKTKKDAAEAEND